MLAVLSGAALAESPSVIHAPTVHGVMMEGETLLAHGGTWTGEPPFTYTFDWQRCNNGFGDCVLIGVPQSESYTLTAADVGFRIRTWVTVTGQDCGEWNSEKIRHCAPATRQGPSEQTPVIVANPRFLPQNTAPPTVSGTPEEGETLRALDGTWTGLEPLVVLRQWERCGADGDGCEPVPEAVDETYEVGRRDIGSTIRFNVTGKNVRGISTPVPSPTTAVVTALLPRPGRTSIDAEKVVRPYRLVIDRLTFAPARLRARVPVVARIRVSDTRGFRIRGAIVRVTSLPIGLFGTVPDASTDLGGWATLRLRPTSRVVFTTGGSIDLLVQAVREGESAVTAQKRAKLPLGAPRK
jgi:hypothetical protein